MALRAHREQIKWKMHPLYAENTKSQLEALCQTLRIPVTPSVTKHQMVSLIAQKRRIPEPSSPPIYSGKLVNVPTTTAAISHMPVSELHDPLKYHGVSFSGTKDQLKVFLLRQGRTAATTTREEEQVKDLIRLVQQLIFTPSLLSFLVCVLFGTPFLHLLSFLMIFLSCRLYILFCILTICC